MIRSVLLVCEDRARGRFIAGQLRSFCLVETWASGVTASSLRQAPDVVIIAAPWLDGTANSQHTRKTIGLFANRNIPVIGVFDAPSIRSVLEARAIGVTAILPAGTPTRVIGQIVSDLTRLSPTRRNADRADALKCAAEDVGAAISTLMTSTGRGDRISGVLTAAASKLLLETMSCIDVDRWLDAVSGVHNQTYRHCLLMAGITAAFVLSLGLNQGDCQRLIRAAVLHDVGKALVPRNILDKPGPLTVAETVILRRHPGWGHELLLAQGYNDPTTLAVVLHHHELLDGSGYPEKLKGDQIKDPVRIATICDIFSALAEERSYKAGMTAADAFKLMLPMAGKLDLALLTSFQRLFVPTTKCQPVH